MKKLVLLIIVLWLGIAGLQAQNKYSFGFEAAPHISWASSNTNKVENNGTAFGIKYGLRGDKFFGDNYAITSGLMISHTNINLTYNDSIEFNAIDDDFIADSGTNVTYHLNYIEIPVGLKFQSNEIGYIRVLFEGGFIPAFELRSKISADDYDVDKQELQEGTIPIALSYYFEGGISYSLGAQLAIKSTIFYSSGMFDITSDEGDRDDRISHNAVGMKLGLIF